MDPNGIVSSHSTLEVPHSTLQRWVFITNAIDNPTRPILYDGDEPDKFNMSFAEYRDLAHRFASGLVAAGLQPGDRVLTVALNSVFCPVAFMGTVMAGGIYCTADPVYDEQDLARTELHLRPRFILADERCIDVVCRALERLGKPRDRLFLFCRDRTQSFPGLQSWWTLFAQPEAVLSGVFEQCTVEESHRTIALIYSSGTTGSPKAVQISHRNYIAAALAHINRMRGGPKGTTPPWRVLGALKLHHILGQRTYGVVFPLLSMPTFVVHIEDYRDALSYISDLRINFAMLRSSTIVEIVKNSTVSAQFRVPSLKRIEACASRLERSIGAQAEQILCASSPTVQIASVWGLTELGHISGWSLSERCDSNSVGQLHINYEGRVVFDDGSVAKTPNQIGEIQIRAPSAASGYWREPALSKALFSADGFVSTGDLGYVDERGMWYITDRLKDLIKRHGTYVSPSELEGVVLEHPGVLDAAVVGVPVDEDEGPLAFVVLRNGCNGSDKEAANSIMDFANGRLAVYKQLVGGVWPIKRIPRNAVSLGVPFRFAIDAHQTK